MLRRRALLPLLLLCACREPSPPDGQFVAQWVRSSLAFVRSEKLGPPVAARISAYASIALYEGYAADPRSNLRSLAAQVNGLWSVPQATSGQSVDGATVAAEAERVVLDSLFSEGVASTRRTIDSLAQAQIQSRRSAGVKADRLERSINHGRALGGVILAWAARDGFLSKRGRPWSPPQTPAAWVNTSTTDRPMEPYWGTLRTFALRNGDECAPPPPPKYSEARGSDFWKMGKELYDSVANLTPEKREIALFWADNSIATGTPGFHWISVVNQMIARRDLTADQAVETYALTSVAIADAFIGCWKEKYRSLVVRPSTYVNRVFSPRWQTEFATPPYPEYPSAHAVLSGAAVEVLARLLGDTIPFTDSSQTDIGATPRSFRSFTHARDEGAVSRVYGGIHFVPAVVHGLTQGQCIGQRVLGRLKTRRDST